MFEETILAEQFQSLLMQSEQAEKMYASLVGNTADPALRQELQQLQFDKQRHVRLARRLLEIVQ